MALSEDDAAALLQHVQRQLRELELGDVLDRITGVDAPSNPGSQLLYLLDALQDEIQLGADETTRATVERLRRVARTRSGAPIAGISLELSPADRNLYGVQRVDLGAAPDLGDVVDELAELRDAVRDALIEGGWG